MKKITTLFALLVGLTAMADIPNGYYTNAVGKSDEALMTALRNIIRPHTQLSYSALWDAFTSPPGRWKW